MTIRDLARASLGIALLPWLSHAAADDGVMPYLSSTIAYDDNLFRLSDGIVPDVESSRRSDISTLLKAGIAMAVTPGRQRLDADANIQQRRFEHFDFLNDTGGQANAAWHWRGGHQWSGDIGYKYLRLIADFTQLQSGIKDVRARERRFFSATRRLHPRWDMQARMAWATDVHSHRSQRSLNQDRIEGEFWMNFASRKASSAALGVLVNRVEFPQRDIVDGSVLDNSYRNLQYAARTGWPVTEHLRFNTTLSWVAQYHRQFVTRDFSGWRWRGAVRWTPDRYIAVDFDAWRDVVPVDYTRATNVLEVGASVSPSWRFGSRFILATNLAYHDRVFQGDPEQMLLGLAQRRDHVYTAGVSFVYARSHAVRLALDLQDERRSSTLASAGYRSRVAAVVMQTQF